MHRQTGAMIDVRSLDGDDDQAEALWVSFTALMIGVPTPELTEQVASFPGRSWGAFEDGRIVGRARAFDVETTVPGGARVATAAISAVGVLPTHTRRGVLSGMMRGQLAEERAGGRVLASLRASEAPIYGRFGYGLAGMSADVRIERGSRLRPEASTRADGAGRLRILRRAELWDAVPALYDDVGRDRVGAISRPESWWQRNLLPATKDSDDRGRWVVVLEDGTGRGTGYVDYEVKAAEDFDDFVHRTLEVRDLFAADLAGYSALWRYLLELDLAGTIVARQRPVDEPLRWMLHDPRALRTTRLADEQWVRLLDVRAALAARTYGAVDTTVVVAVRDPMFPDNDGTFRIGPEKVEETSDPPELQLDVAEAGAVYLGGTSVSELVAVGRVEERTPGAAHRADVLLGVQPAPWCGSFF